MRKKVIHTFILFSFLILATTSCSWLPSWAPNPFSKKELVLKEGGSCQKEGLLVLKGKAPHQLPILQNETGQWRLTGVDPDDMETFDRKKVRIRGECPALPADHTFLLPEFRIFSLTVLENK